MTATYQLVHPPNVISLTHVKPANLICSMEESAVCRFPHTQARTYPGLVGITVIDRLQKVQHVRHPESTVSFTSLTPSHGKHQDLIWR